MDEAMVRKRCEDLRLKWLEDASSGDSMIDLAVQVYRAAYADGLDAAAIIARERGKPHDIDWWHNSSKREISRRTAIDLAELIEQHAKEMGHE